MQDDDRKGDVGGTTRQTNLLSTKMKRGILTNAGSNPFSAKTAEILATLDIKVPIVPTTHKSLNLFKGYTQSPNSNFSQSRIRRKLLCINSQYRQQKLNRKIDLFTRSDNPF